MSDEKTSFVVPVYAEVWKSDLDRYLEGDLEDIQGGVTLKVGVVPDTYSEYDHYMPVGLVTVNIPCVAERLQSELMALDGAIESEKKESMARLEDLQDRKKKLLALPHWD